MKVIFSRLIWFGMFPCCLSVNTFMFIHGIHKKWRPWCVPSLICSQQVFALAGNPISMKYFHFLIPKLSAWHSIEKLTYILMKKKKFNECKIMYDPSWVEETHSLWWDAPLKSDTFFQAPSMEKGSLFQTTDWEQVRNLWWSIWKAWVLLELVSNQW